MDYVGPKLVTVGGTANYYRMLKLKEFFAKISGKVFPGIPQITGEKAKRVMGPGVGTNRMRRVREGKNW